MRVSLYEASRASQVSRERRKCRRYAKSEVLAVDGPERVQVYAMRNCKEPPLVRAKRPKRRLTQHSSTEGDIGAGRLTRAAKAAGWRQTSGALAAANRPRQGSQDLRGWASPAAQRLHTCPPRLTPYSPLTQRPNQILILHAYYSDRYTVCTQTIAHKPLQAFGQGGDKECGNQHWAGQAGRPGAIGRTGRPTSGFVS